MYASYTSYPCKHLVMHTCLHACNTIHLFRCKHALIDSSLTQVPLKILSHSLNDPRLGLWIAIAIAVIVVHFDALKVEIKTQSTYIPCSFTLSLSLPPGTSKAHCIYLCLLILRRRWSSILQFFAYILRDCRGLKKLRRRNSSGRREKNPSEEKRKK